MSKPADATAELKKWKEKFFDLQDSFDGSQKEAEEYK